MFIFWRKQKLANVREKILLFHHMHFWWPFVTFSFTHIFMIDVYCLTICLCNNSPLHIINLNGELVDSDALSKGICRHA
jgi:hypothetical protein